MEVAAGRHCHTRMLPQPSYVLGSDRHRAAPCSATWVACAAFAYAANEQPRPWLLRLQTQNRMAPGDDSTQVEPEPETGTKEPKPVASTKDPKPAGESKDEIPPKASLRPVPEEPEVEEPEVEEPPPRPVTKPEQPIQPATPDEPECTGTCPGGAELSGSARANERCDHSLCQVGGRLRACSRLGSLGHLPMATTGVVACASSCM